MHVVIDAQLIIIDAPVISPVIAMYFVIDDQLMIGDHLRLQGL